MSDKTMKVGRQYRDAHITREAVNVEARTIELAFSSETPVERWFGQEILGHAAGECNLDWLSSGRAPFLVDHNTRQQIGVVTKAWIGNDRIGRALVRLSESDRAEQELKDCAAGIRVNVSVGYDLDELALVGSNGEPGADDAESVYRAKWTPWEISTVAIPADTAVGVGRDRIENERDVPVVHPPNMTSPRTRTRETMETVEQKAAREAAEQATRDQAARDEAARTSAAGATAAAITAERQRATDIAALGARHHRKDLADKAIADGTSIEAFRGIMLGAIEPGRPLETVRTDLGMSDKEARAFSVVRMLNAQVAVRMGNGDFKSLAPFELECHEEIQKRLGVSGRGFFVPMDAQRIAYPTAQAGQRDLTVGTNSAGGYLVGTEYRPQDFITLLRSAMMVRQMGATVLSGLVGAIAIPKQSGAGTAYWLAENAEPTETAQTVAQVALTPKTIGAYTDYSRKLLLQASPTVEGFVRSDLSTILGLGIDLAGLHGTGANDQPTGIAATSGIGSVAGGTDGAAPTWANIVALETAVAVANADVGNTGYLTNAKVRGKLKTTEKASSTAQFVWGDNMAQPGFGMLNGYKAGVSNQVSSTLTKGNQSLSSAIFFGNWADLLIGEWGVLDLMVNPYTGANAGTVRVHAFQSVDVAVRRAGSFSAMLDALTA